MGPPGDKGDLFKWLVAQKMKGTIATLSYDRSKGNVLPELRLEKRNFCSTTVVKETYSRSSGPGLTTYPLIRLGPVWVRN